MTSLTRHDPLLRTGEVPSGGQPLEGRPAGWPARVWLVLQGLFYLPSGILLMIQAFSVVDPATERDLTPGLVEHPVVRILLAVIGALIVGLGFVMTVHGFTQGRQRALPRAPASLRSHIGWLSGVGAVGRGVVFAAGGALLLVEVQTNSRVDAGRVARAVRMFWQQPYGRPLLFATGLTFVLFGIYEFAAATYRPAPVGGATTQTSMRAAGRTAMSLARSNRTVHRPVLDAAGERRSTNLVILLGAMVGIFSVMWVLGMLLVHGPVPPFLTRGDHQVSEWFFDHRTPDLNRITHFGSMMSDTINAIALTTTAVVVLRLWLGRWRESLVVVVAIVGELLIFLSVTATVHRYRPSVPHLDHAAATSSFPSGHTGAAAALYGCLAVILLRNVSVRWAAVTLATLGFAIPLVVAVSRVYRGMHFVTDVLAGALVSGMWLTVVLLILLPVRRRVSSEDGALDERHIESAVS
jgi:membrane-associated phospholipid phosphatase